MTHPAYIYALSDRIYDLVILLKFDAYSAKIRGDWQMSMNFIDLADKGMQLIEDVERQVVSPEQAKVLIEAHKNARENYKLIVDVLKLIQPEVRSSHAVLLLEAKPTIVVDNKKKTGT